MEELPGSRLETLKGEEALEATPETETLHR
jgi:hypothetical protein